MLRIVTSSSGRIGTATLPGWAVALGAVAAGALGLVVLLLGAGLALLLAPVVVGAVLVARWRLKKALREAGVDLDRRTAGPGPDGVIDADYRVIDEPTRR